MIAYHDLGAPAQNVQYNALNNDPVKDPSPPSYCLLPCFFFLQNELDYKEIIQNTILFHIVRISKILFIHFLYYTCKKMLFGELQLLLIKTKFVRKEYIHFYLSIRFLSSLWKLLAYVVG